MFFVSNMNKLASSSGREKSTESGIKSAESGRKSSARKRKSTDSGNESPKKGKARLVESQDGGQTGDRLTASVETPHKVPRSLKSKVALTLPTHLR